MSTRATYQIDNTTFYIHHDGYPAGAAEYFAAALRQDNAGDRAPNAQFADDFHRANTRAEITRSHDAHGDTDYRYTVTTNGDLRSGTAILHLVAQTRTGSVFFDGTVQEFIHQYAYPGIEES